MSYRNYSQDKRKIFDNPERVHQLLEEIAEQSKAKDAGKQKKPKAKRGKPKSEKAKSQRPDKAEIKPPELEAQSLPEPVSSEAKPEPALETPKTKLETPAPKSTPKLKRELTEEQKLAYIITAGPILSQIHHAFDSADNTDASVVFALEERIYRPKGKPKVDRESVCRVRVLNFGYDDSPEPKRWQHLVITGEVDLLSQHLPETPYYPDGTPFMPGAKIKLFYNLEARCGFIIKIAATNEVFSPCIPEGMGYVAPDSNF